MRTVIAITGDLGSGKSTVARRLAERLGRGYLSTGSMQRDIAARMGLTTRELNDYSATNREIDDTIDGALKDLAGSEEPLVVDSRLAWHFVPGALTVYLVVSPSVGAERVQADATRTSESYPDRASAAVELARRQAGEQRRFRDLYGVELGRLANYDVVVDTTYLEPERVVECVVAAASDDAGAPGGLDGPRLWLCPAALVPSALPSGGDDGPVVVERCGRAFVVVHGHGTVAGALAPGGPDVVVARLSAEDAPGCGERIDPAVVAAWEEAHGVRLPDATSF